MREALRELFPLQQGNYHNKAHRQFEIIFSFLKYLQIFQQYMQSYMLEHTLRKDFLLTELLETLHYITKLLNFHWYVFHKKRVQILLLVLSRSHFLLLKPPSSFHKRIPKNAQHFHLNIIHNKLWVINLATKDIIRHVPVEVKINLCNFRDLILKQYLSVMILLLIFLDFNFKV